MKRMGGGVEQAFLMNYAISTYILKCTYEEHQNTVFIPIKKVFPQYISKNKLLSGMQYMMYFKTVFGKMGCGR